MRERFAGRYVLLKPLGSGGMGDVFLALDLTTGAECALKRLARRTPLATPELMRREFEALTRVRHPAIIAVYELGFDFDGTPYYTMEYVPGVPADRALARGDWVALPFVAAEVARGLEALHAAGVTHGDLKPSNLLVVPGPGRGALPAAVRLVDFGLAALRDEHAGGHRGTPGFAAPEVVRGERPGVASDLYGLGSTLYALVAGRPPFEGENPSSMLRRQQQGPPPARPLEESGAPPALVRLILRLLAPSPLERPVDAREARRELERLHPAARRPLADRMRGVVTAGRERELAWLESRGEAGGERARLVILVGEAGMGKSTLLGELAARAALAGRSVAWLVCAGGEGAGASALRIARRLAAEAGTDLDADQSLTPAARVALAGESPELPEAELSALVESVAAWSRAAARRRSAPLLLVDDSERMDPLSRAFARRIMVHPAAAPMAWVWARRPDATGGPEDERLLLEAGLAETLKLGPLDAGGLERLAAARLGEPVPPALLEFLVRGTGGHPGLAVEMLRAAADRGALLETETGLVLVPERLEGLTTPPSFEASLLERFAAAPPAARAVALALAVMGRPLGAERLRAIEPRADEAAADALIAAGLAARDEYGALGLMPPALAGALFERLDPLARAALHRAALASGPLPDRERFHHLADLGEIGPALGAAEAAFASRPDARLAAAAAALAEPERHAEAAAWHERAARALSSRGRYAAARPHLERALALDPSPEARPGRWVMLSTACLRAGRPEDAARVAAAALAEPLPAAARGLVLGNEASRLLGLGMRDEALPLARESLALAESTGDDAAIGATAMTLSAALLECGAGAAAAAMADRAVEAFARAGDVTRELRALGASASIAHARREPAEAERLHREAIARARAHDARLPLEEMLLNSAVALGEAGRWAESRQAAAESLRLALEDGRPRGAALALANLAQTDGLMGDASNALREARAALKLCRVHAPQLLDFAWRSLSQALRNAGRLRRAERFAQRALARRMRGSADEGGDWCRIELGRVRAARGDWSRAGALWERPLAEVRPIGSVDRAVLTALAGRAALRRGAFDVAAARLEATDAWLGDHAAPYAAAMAEQLRAELALAQGRAAEGIACAGRALERLERLPAERAQAALELSRLALASEGEVKAPLGAWLDLAAGIFERLGDHRGREATLALTVEWLRRAGTRAPAAGRERNLIESVSRLINSMSDFQELTRRAMQAAVEQLDAERGVLLLADAESGRLSPVAEHGAVDATTRRDAVGYSRRVVQRVAESGGSLLIGDAPADPEARSQSVVDLRLRSIVCVPLYLGGRVVGAVYLDDSRRPDVFSDADRALLEGFAHLMAVAIENSRGHQEVLRANELLVGENLSLRKEVSARFRAESLIATSSAMLRVLAIVERAARVGATVLLTGENGTGKELVARIMHHSGKRRLKPFVAVNCGAIPESLLETELFGILPQVATDVRARDGRFVQADGGTLFLDEVGEMPLKQQVALLSAIASREITPVGGGKPIPVDVRIIAASNRDLRRLVERGAFREDLYYRLNVIPIEIPPLRERKADIPALAQHFVALHARQQEREVPRFSREFLAVLMQSDWPGNVRELQNYIERVLAMTPGDTLHPIPPPRDLDERAGRVKLGHGGTLASMVEDLERRAIEEALERSAGNQSHAARRLGMTEQSLRYRIRKYVLSSDRQKWRIRRK